MPGFYGKHECIYCGAKASSNFLRGPYDDKSLCNVCYGKLREINYKGLPVFKPKYVVNPRENSEEKYINSMLSKKKKKR